MLKNTAQWLLAIVCAAFLAAGMAMAQDAFPPLAKCLTLSEGELEVDAGRTWTKALTAPAIAEDESPVLSLRARVHVPNAGSGCNYVLQVLIDGRPLTETLLRPRLLNKPPYFDPPKTNYHFSWYGPQHQGWMTLFSPTYETNWGGTGHDCEFVFDLTGMVAGGEATTVEFQYLNPGIPKALKLDRAPLALDRVTLGVLKRSDMERLRSAVHKGMGVVEAPVSPDLPPDAKQLDSAYEVVWSGRKESPPAQVAFDNLRGWKMLARGDVKVGLSASIERLLWRPQLAKLTYSGGTQETVVELRPPQPILLPSPFDAANLWIYGDLKRSEDSPIRIAAVLEDQGSRDFQIDLGAVHATYWTLHHGVFDAKDTAKARPPLKFVALAIAIPKVKGERRIYLESLAFYEQNRKPVARLVRPDPPIFPTSDEGMLPTPPADCKGSVKAIEKGAEFISETAAGVLRYRVAPEEGMFQGVSAQWKEGPVFHPMDGGTILLDFGEGEVRPPAKPTPPLSSEVKGDSLRARWGFNQGERRAEWEATYTLRGRTLVVDVKCAGGAATGVAMGEVAGLPAPRGIEVPYLAYGYKPGPWIACAGDVFVSVLPDWYHSDFTMVDTNITAPQEERIGLLRATTYVPLTNGRRNDLRDRVLVTVSPEFSETLPTTRNPVSPNRERLSKYMFFMATWLTADFWKTLKRYGIDHVIANDFAGIFVKDYAEGFATRWRPHPLLTVEQVQKYRQEIKSLGYLFGMYIDARDFFPLNELWDENKVALTKDGDLRDGWYGNFIAKSTVMPELVRAVGQKTRELYPADCVYLDTHTNMFGHVVDQEAGVEGAGMARYYVYGNGDCILEARKWYGSTMSEGIFRWLYAGVCDMDYATAISTTQPPADLPLLVDFDLLKIHPLQHGTMMGYSHTAFLSKEDSATLYQDNGRGTAPIPYYRYVSASLAYGHMLILGYGYNPPLSRFIQYYATMQGVQKEYLTDTAAEIHYHNGTEFLPTSRALREDAVRLGRVRVRYSRGLVVHVNYNAQKIWTVEAEGKSYELPPYGWLIVKPGEILSYSVLKGGGRVDFVRCPEYIYMSTGNTRNAEGPVETQGAVWLKREGEGWRVIPCGNLGAWQAFPPPGLPPHMRDFRLSGIPADKGCPRLVLDTKALLDKGARDIQLTPRRESGEALPTTGNPLDDNHLEIPPVLEAVDYLLQ